MGDVNLVCQKICPCSLTLFVLDAGAPNAANVGFIYYRANSRTLRLLQLWQTLRLEPETVDQYVFPRAVQQARTELPMLTVTSLDAARYAGGCGVNKRKWWCCNSRFPRNVAAETRQQWVIFHATCVYGPSKTRKVTLLKNVLALCMPH